MRKLRHDKPYALINVLGLSVGFACFALIFLFVAHEWRYDRHFEGHENIYRLNTEIIVDGTRRVSAKSSPLLAPLLAQDHPELRLYTRALPLVQRSDKVLILNGDEAYYWDKVIQGDASLFTIFNHDILHGDPSLLDTPRAMVVSESFARRYFGDENPVGRTLALQDPGNDYVIQAVFRDLPGNTSLRYDVVLTNAPPVLEGDMASGLLLLNTYSYVRLSEDFDPAGFAAISDAFFERHLEEGVRRLYPGVEGEVRFSLQALGDIHLSAGIQADFPPGNRTFLVSLALVGVFILLIAAINYINLATARYSRNAREAGVRRTLGAGGRQLALQFLAEALLFTVLSLALGLSLAELLLSLDFFTEFLGRLFELSLTHDLTLLSSLGVLAILLGVLTGVLPALHYARLPPAVALRFGRGGQTGKAQRLRAALVAAQMLLSIAVISAAVLMSSQVDFLKDRPLGLEKENKLITAVDPRAADTNVVSLMQELRRHPGIANVSMSEIVPGTNAGGMRVLLEDDAGREESLQVRFYRADEHYPDTLGITLLEGRTLPAVAPPPSDGAGYPVLVNQALVRAMAWREPLGKAINFPVNGRRGVVAGVVADYAFGDPRDFVEPLVLLPYDADSLDQRYLIISLAGGASADVLEYIEARMRDAQPRRPFDHVFLDQSLAALYGGDEREAELLALFSAVCIAIAILGLMGLTAHQTDQRGKEIGIRKILGASTPGILAMLFGPLCRLILLAAVLASGLAWLGVSRWLEGYAYRIDIHPAVFIGVSLAVLLLAFLTMSSQTWRVVRANPVKSLRYE